MSSIFYVYLATSFRGISLFFVKLCGFCSEISSNIFIKVLHKLVFMDFLVVILLFTRSFLCLHKKLLNFVTVFGNWEHFVEFLILLIFFLSSANLFLVLSRSHKFIFNLTTKNFSKVFFNFYLYFFLSCFVLILSWFLRDVFCDARHGCDTQSWDSFNMDNS